MLILLFIAVCYYYKCGSCGINVHMRRMYIHGIPYYAVLNKVQHFFCRWAALETINPAIVSAAAVYWADNKIRQGGGVYAHWVENVDNHPLKDTAAEIVADPAWMFIVTWDQMEPNIATPKTTDVRIIFFT